jgi:hypothetical protein
LIRFHFNSIAKTITTIPMVKTANTLSPNVISSISVLPEFGLHVFLTGNASADPTTCVESLASERVDRTVHLFAVLPPETSPTPEHVFLRHDPKALEQDLQKRAACHVVGETIRRLFERYRFENFDHGLNISPC